MRPILMIFHIRRYMVFVSVLFGVSISMVVGCSCNGSKSINDADDAGMDSGMELPDTDTEDNQIGFPDAGIERKPCNGMPSLCKKRFDEVVYLTTHNAMAYESPPFVHIFQEKTIRKQLDEGVRGIWLAAHLVDDNLSLCFDDCSKGQLAINIALTDVAEFLEVNPRQVVSILITSKVPTNKLVGAIEDSKAAPWLGTLASKPPFDTLEEIIQSEKRLFIFVDEKESAIGDSGIDEDTDTGIDSKPAWLHSFSHYLWSTDDTFTSVNSMDCNPSTGSSKAPLYVVNHFLASQQTEVSNTSVKADAELINQMQLTENRLTNCDKQHNQKPTFVVVNFYNKEVISAVNAVNSLQ